MDGAGPHRRGVEVETAEAVSLRGLDDAVTVTVRNTGEATDLFRISAAVGESGWNALIDNALADIPAGRTAAIPVRITRPSPTANTAQLVFTAASESDNSKKASATVALSAAR